VVWAAKYTATCPSNSTQAPQNHFGIYLEYGIGIHQNGCLITQYDRRVTEEGRRDGANHCGFYLVMAVVFKKRSK
jgi:hypothetical protein